MIDPLKTLSNNNLIPDALEMLIILLFSMYACLVNKLC